MQKDKEYERLAILLEMKKISELQLELNTYKQMVDKYKLEYKLLKKKYKQNLVLPEVYSNNKYLYKGYIKENKKKVKFIKKELNKVDCVY